MGVGRRRWERGGKTCRIDRAMGAQAHGEDRLAGATAPRPGDMHPAAVGIAAAMAFQDQLVKPQVIADPGGDLQVGAAADLDIGGFALKVL